MSLFHLSEWYSERFAGATSMVVAQIIDDRDQLVVGSLEGTLIVIDPGGNVEQRHEVSVVVQMDLKLAVLQVAVGRYLTSFDQPLIATLHPNLLQYFRISSNDSEMYFLERVFERRISGDPSFNMCQGHFGGSHIEQICVQSLNCRLSIFEGESGTMNYQISDAIFPGPIQYVPTNDSLLFSSGSYLNSVRFASLIAFTTHREMTLPPSGAAAAWPNISKKLQIDWQINFGDTPLDVNVIYNASIQPSIVILCKRSVYCITHGGSIRYVIRLQDVATCMTINHTNKDTEIQICVGLAVKTLIFYHDSKVVWNAQALFTPIYVNIANFNNTKAFSESLRCLLTLLSDDGLVFVGYLGVQQSMSRMPITESRYIDFERRRQELRQFEETIWRAGRENQDSLDDSWLHLHAEITMDDKSMAYDVNVDNIPSATLHIDVSNISDQADVAFQGDIFAERTNFSLTGLSNRLSTTIFCKNQPTFDLRCTTAITTNSAEILMYELLLPLRLVCRTTAAQRTATYKLSLDSSETCIHLTQLFSDRYRIQSNSMAFLFVVLSELVRRLREKQSEVRLHSSMPVNIIRDTISKHLQCENSLLNAERQVSKIVVQMRHSETILLSKLKSNREPFAPHISAFINYTYSETMSALDLLLEATVRLNDKQGGKSICALINLINTILELCSETPLPFDGRMIEGVDVKFGHLINYFLTDTTDEIDVEKPINVEQLTQTFTNYCERKFTKTEQGLSNVPEEEWEKSVTPQSIPPAENDQYLELKSSLMSAHFAEEAAL